MRAEPKKGTVFLVGAGPGNPGLLTLRGCECLRGADVVVYDQLANRALLAYAPEDAERIDVGKKGGSHTMGQGEINDLIVRLAREGRNVVRLKGGDPFIFGRGGEEAQALVRAGVPFEVVPGVTSAIAVPAYAGIPLTHREYTPTVAFITGHEDPAKERTEIAWDKLATGVGTLVFLMGVGNLEHIAGQLMAHGRDGDTPVAIIRQGTLPVQKTLTGKLQDIAQLAREADLKPPAVIVVGAVAGLRRELNWFEARPLFGRRIVVTRAREQASGFLERLGRLGADCIQFPTIQVVPPQSWEALDQAIQRLERYQWLLFTSVNGVRFFLRRLQAQGRDVRDLKGLKIGAIGPKTAQAWEDMGLRPDLVPDEYRAEAVVACFRERGTAGVRILLPRASEAREILPDELRRMGAEVDVVPAYRTVKPDHDTARVRRLFADGSIDMLTFTSSSTVSNFIEMFASEQEPLRGWVDRVAVACIGPITAETARRAGLPVHVVPEAYTVEALTAAIVRYYQS